MNFITRITSICILFFVVAANATTAGGFRVAGVGLKDFACPGRPLAASRGDAVDAHFVKVGLWLFLFNNF